MSSTQSLIAPSIEAITANQAPTALTTFRDPLAEVACAIQAAVRLYTSAKQELTDVVGAPSQWFFIPTGLLSQEFLGMKSRNPSG